MIYSSRIMLCVWCNLQRHTDFWYPDYTVDVFLLSTWWHPKSNVIVYVTIQSSVAM